MPIIPDVYKRQTLGRTGITVNKNGFGALPIQRVGADYAGKLLRKAYDAGITYFDTARSYTDSEEKMGLALADVRPHLFIATKTPSPTGEGFWKDLETSLRLLKTDYIDVYQFHNPAFCPKPDVYKRQEGNLPWKKRNAPRSWWW